MRLNKVIYRLGIDIGSTTIKMAMVKLMPEERDKHVSEGEERASDREKNASESDKCEGKIEVVATEYRRHNADPLHVGENMLQHILDQSGLSSGDEISIGITGSVGMGYAQRLGIRFYQEVIAAAEVVKRLYPDVHTLVDIGGEDSKMIFFEEGRVPDMRMNGNCAGGTGAFIDQTATLLGVETEALNGLAEKAEHLYPIASRCGVFSKTDIQNLISRAVSKEDIAASMLNAVSQQVVSALARGTDVHPKIFLCGGPFAYIPELRKHLLDVLKMDASDCIVPEFTQYVPAIGTALLAEGEAISCAHARTLFKNSASLVSDRSTAASLPPFFETESEYESWLADKRIRYRHDALSAPVSSAGKKLYLGVDSGSTTTKLVLIDEEGNIVFSDYSYNNGNSFEAFRSALERMRAALGEATEISASCSTGYGEQLLKTAFGLEYGIVETMAHFMAAKHLQPEVSFVLDIGGQDMKAIFVEHGSIRRIEINEACSSGCGSFIMTFARQLGYEISDFARMATLASHPYDLGTRCTVFMNSKVKQAMREGASIDDIAAGFSYSVIKNCLYKVLKLQSFDQLGEHIMVQGGTFRNHSVVRALEILSGKEVGFGPIPELMGAYGCALYAMRQAGVRPYTENNLLITY